MLIAVVSNRIINTEDLYVGAHSYKASDCNSIEDLLSLFIRSLGMAIFSNLFEALYCLDFSLKAPASTVMKTELLDIRPCLQLIGKKTCKNHKKPTKNITLFFSRVFCFVLFYCTPSIGGRVRRGCCCW